MQYIAVTLATICIVVASGDRRCSKSRGCGPSMCGPLEVPVRGRPRRDHFCRPLFTPPWELRKRRNCVCKRRYLRNSWGECIPWKKCAMCKFRWQRDYRACAPGCPATCNMPLVTSCNRPCTSGCVCPPGWVVHPKRSRMCIKAYKCLPKCPANSSFQACAPSCLPKCGHNQPKECAVTCNTGACVCHEGYLEREQGGKTTCVLQSKCSWYTSTTNSFRPNATHHNGESEWSHSAISSPGGTVRHPAITSLPTWTDQPNGARRHLEDTPSSGYGGHSVATSTIGSESALPGLTGEAGGVGFGTDATHTPGAGRDIVAGSLTSTGNAFPNGSAGIGGATVGVPTRRRTSNVSAGRGGKPVVFDGAGARSPGTEHSTSAGSNSRSAISSATPGVLGVTSGVVAASAASAVAVAASRNANTPATSKPLHAMQPSGGTIPEGSESGGTVGHGGVAVSESVRAPSGDTLRQGWPNFSVGPGVLPPVTALSSAIESQPAATISLGNEGNLSAGSMTNTGNTLSRLPKESSEVGDGAFTVSAHSNAATGTSTNVNVLGKIDKRLHKAPKPVSSGDGTNTESSLRHTSSSLPESTDGDTFGKHTTHVLEAGGRSVAVSGTRDTLPLTTGPLSAGTGTSTEGSLPNDTKIFGQPLGGETSLDSSTSVARATGGGSAVPDTMTHRHTGSVSPGAINVENTVSTFTASAPGSAGTKPAIGAPAPGGVGRSPGGAGTGTAAIRSATARLSGAITFASEGTAEGGAMSGAEATVLSNAAAPLSAGSGTIAGSSLTQPLPDGPEARASSFSRD